MEIQQWFTKGSALSRLQAAMIGLFCVAAALVLFSGRSRDPMEKALKETYATVPPIDAKVPKHIETATFALG